MWWRLCPAPRHCGQQLPAPGLWCVHAYENPNPPAAPGHRNAAQARAWNNSWRESAWKPEPSTQWRTHGPMAITELAREPYPSRDPTFIFSYYHQHDGHDAYGTSDRPAVDILADTGANQSLCGPQAWTRRIKDGDDATNESSCDTHDVYHCGQRRTARGADVVDCAHPLDVAQHDRSHRRRRNDHASDGTEGSEITRQTGEGARTH